MVKTKNTKAEEPKFEPKEEEAVAPEISFQEITIDLIDDPERPIRTNLTSASVEDLMLSIKQVGIIEPLVVKPVNGRYEVIAGHRRLLAARLAKIVAVPCYIRPATKEEAEILKIHENLYRSEIKPQDEALHFSHLIQKQKITPIKIAQMISKSPTYVTDRLAILEYPDFLKEALDKKEVSFSVATEFARFDDLKQMRQAVYYARRGGMTQEMAHKWVVDYRRSKENPGFQEHKVVDETNGQTEIEHTAQCIYCSQQVRLIEAEVVYMHSKCLKEAKQPAPPAETPEPEPVNV